MRVPSDARLERLFCSAGGRLEIAEPEVMGLVSRAEVKLQGGGRACPENEPFEFPNYFTYSKMVLV